MADRVVKVITPADTYDPLSLDERTSASPGENTSGFSEFTSAFCDIADMAGLAAGSTPVANDPEETFEGRKRRYRGLSRTNLQAR
jgi:hypothetical protein